MDDHAQARRGGRANLRRRDFKRFAIGGDEDAAIRFAVPTINQIIGAASQRPDGEVEPKGRNGREG